MNTNNYLNKIVSLFDSLNKEFTPDFCLVDIFSNHFSFTSVSHKDPKTWVAHQNRLDNIYENSLINQDTIHYSRY